MYPVISFLASHVTLVAIIGGTCAFLASLAGFFVVAMPALEKKTRPAEYIYIGWAHKQDVQFDRDTKELMGSVVLRNMQRFEWEHGKETMTFSMPEPPAEFSHHELQNAQDMRVLAAIIPAVGDQTIVMMPFRGQRYQLPELSAFSYNGITSNIVGIEWYWWPWVPEDKVSITRGTRR